LRKDRPLLDTRIQSRISISRLFPALCVALLAGSAAHGQAPVASEPPKAVKPAAPVEPRTSFNWVHVDEPDIAMTFDDGPHATLTPKLLDLLAARHIKVTFFVLGECVEQNPEVLRRAAREGHEIGNHSWSHPQLNKMSDEAVRSQLRRTDDAIKAITGKRPTLFRPPYGAITARQKKWIHDEFGYQIIMWDVDPLDWKDPGPTTVANRILKETRPGSIVLSHDIHKGTIEAMPSTLEQLESKHFKFVTVTELIGLATPEPPKAEPAHKTVPSSRSSQSGTIPASPAPAATPMENQARSPSPVPAATATPSPGH
jgi:peptidoglycan/xylan/chitin deacetylase (PgdA/CDA1 family)